MSNRNRFAWVPVVGEVLGESSWVTSVWEWLQKLLGRAADLVLWITMIFFCYQLIPGAPMPPQTVSSFMFIMQFVALDVGGMGLNRLAQEANLGRWAYARVVAYILIGITLATITYSGLEHAVTLSKDITSAVEVVLVIARSVMTVLYGQAVHSLKVESHAAHDRLITLEREVPDLRNQVSSLQQQLSTEQQRVSTVQGQLDAATREVSNLRGQLSSEQQRVASLTHELETGHGDTVGLRQELNAVKLEAESLRGRLDAKVRELDGMREDQAGVVQMRRDLNAAKLNVEDLRAELDRKTRALESVQSDLEREQQEVSNLREQLSTVQSQVSSNPGVQVSSGQKRKGDTGQEKIVKLDSRRPGRQLAKEIYRLMVDNPGISGRAMAGQLGCSPTTANEWKKFFDDGGTLEQLFGADEAVGE